MSERIYDVSLTIYPGMITWPGDPPFIIETFKSIDKGDSSNISLLHMGSHTATHVDAPRHFITGSRGVDNIDPSVLLGKARLFQLPDVQNIDGRLVEALDLRDVTRLLLGTRNSSQLKQGKFKIDYVSVTEDAADYIVSMGIKLIGVDYLSIEEYHKTGNPVHNTLLSAGVVIIEGLNLAGVPSGDYELLCLPLKIKDADGAPARVLLREL